MQAVGISDIDLNGLLFIRFPSEYTIDESRDRLELMVYESEKRCNPLLEDDEIFLSPASIYTAFFLNTLRKVRSLSAADRTKYAKIAWRKRAARIAPLLKK